ncbi:hypothetical protein FACS1894201_10470 [Bacteroidia bacterium]|nr:hypothetical protein FACS1894201_10470 [Bacteroidia bacterium]
MGIELAECFAKEGAEVTLICGHSAIPSRHPNVHRINVMSAQEMYDHALKAFTATDIAVLAAAVADYRPVSQSLQKIKKTGDKLTLELVKNPDILATLGKKKTKSQILVGFALETEHELLYARQKLQAKNLDYIVLNSLNDPGAGFKTNTNKITILSASGAVQTFDLKPKAAVAVDIVNTILV